MTNPVTVIIPARGNSKGIPRKNLRTLCGKPLIAHSIEQAMQTRDVGRIFVSTEDMDIADVVWGCGVGVIDRPPDLATDTATSESALIHALDYLDEEYDIKPDTVVFLQATSPLRQPDDIQNAIDQFRHDKADSLFSACPAHGFLWRNGKDGPAPIDYDPANRPMRQDTEETLVENGSIYIFKPDVLRKYNSRLGGKISVYRMSVMDSFQVDEPQDLELMEILATQRRRKNA